MFFTVNDMFLSTFPESAKKKKKNNTHTSRLDIRYTSACIKQQQKNILSTFRPWSKIFIRTAIKPTHTHTSLRVFFHSIKKI